MKTKKVKFVQIAIMPIGSYVSSRGIYAQGSGIAALDDKGGIWFFSNIERKWSKIESPKE